MGLHRDIAEQPDRLRNLLEAQRATVETIAASVRATDVKFVFLAARGTSDNAGRYANYLWGAINRLPMALATPSLFTYYRRPPRLREALPVRPIAGRCKRTERGAATGLPDAGNH
jgi:glucosamine--fructose-6-phosphate aminotransferase (isomerizing)